MKLHLVHHWFPLCRVHNEEMRARSINNGHFAGTLSCTLSLRSQRYGRRIRDHHTVYCGIRRTQTIVSLRYYILGYKRIRRIPSGWWSQRDGTNVEEGDRITRENRNLPLYARWYFRRNYAARTPFRNKSAIASGWRQRLISFRTVSLGELLMNISDSPLSTHGLITIMKPRRFFLSLCSRYPRL